MWPIPQLRGKYIRGCYNEWLFLRDTFLDGLYSLLNTRTMQNIELPQLDASQYWHCIFMSPPMTVENFCILLIGGVYYQKLTRAHGETEVVRGEFTLDLDIWTIKATTNFEGKLHAFIAPQFDLVMADFSDPDLRFTMVIKGEPLFELLFNNRTTTYALIESCGGLLLVYASYYGKEVVDVGIFRAEFSSKEWLKVESLGDRAIFLQIYSTSLSCSQA